MNAHANTIEHSSPGDLVSFDEFLNQLGRTAITGWRWRRRGMIKTVDVLGRLYVSRGEIARFESRAARGEFARNKSHISRAEEVLNR
jgi:hypothetical protein